MPSNRGPSGGVLGNPLELPEVPVLVKWLNFALDCIREQVPEDSETVDLGMNRFVQELLQPGSDSEHLEPKIILYYLKIFGFLTHIKGTKCTWLVKKRGNV